MKVLQLGKFYPIRGGVEKVMWDLTKGLGERGVKCDMLCACFRKDMPDGGELRLSGNSRIICVPAIAKLAATMISPAMICRLRSLLKKERYDIVHIHHPDPMAALALFLSGYKGRVLLHWHSDILKQKGFLKLYLPLQNWLLGRAEKIIGTTPVYVRESPHLASFQDKVTCLPIGVAAVPEGSFIDKEGKKIVFSLGRLVPYKGYRYLIEAARYLPDDFLVVIGGTGPLREELQELVGSHSLEGKVRLLGYLSDEDARGWFHACDVFALSSTMKTEAFAIVQIEAMSCAKPVVATKIPGSGVSWVNEDGVSGVNVAVGDPVALAEAIIALCDETANREYGRRAYHRYLSLFTLEKMTDNCLKIYCDETEPGF